MFDRRATWSLPALLAVVSLCTWLLGGWVGGGAGEAPAAAPDAPRSTHHQSSRAPAERGHVVRWIVAGGGPYPELNQVQIEQDLALAVDTLGATGAGLVLYAGGPGAASVQVSTDHDEDPLLTRLRELFDPRSGRDATYRPTELTPIGAASTEAITEALRGALTAGRGPLTVYLAGHGDGGEEPAQSLFLTWGPDDLDVPTLAELLDEATDHRPVRFVMTSCYAGGFADIAFTGADPNRGTAADDRCGFFATTWDRAASGCDPNPERGGQQGYGIHFLHALGGRDRHGVDAMAAIDLDGDGAVSLAEAHARARIASRSLDVPVTTSERFLRAAAPMPGVAREAPDEPTLPSPASATLRIEWAVVDALTERLGLDTPADVSARLDRLHERARPMGEALDEIDTQIAWTRQELAAELLHRWPVLDDPWHPDFAATVADQREAILAHLATSGAAGREIELGDRREAVAAAYDDLLIDAAPMERLERALETLDLAARLRAEGGSYWRRYLRFLACENGAP